MKLIIGGRAQGKLGYALNKYGENNSAVFDGEIPQNAEEEKIIIINHFNLWVRKRLIDRGNPEDEIAEFLRRCPNCVVISDEIGNGIVPMEPFEREYRERTGRMLVEMAKNADEVERVVCGIGQKIK